VNRALASPDARLRPKAAAVGEAIRAAAEAMGNRGLKYKGGGLPRRL
jgi:hypothetical protein